MEGDVLFNGWFRELSPTLGLRIEKRGRKGACESIGEAALL